MSTHNDTTFLNRIASRLSSRSSGSSCKNLNERINSYNIINKRVPYQLCSENKIVLHDI